MEPFSIFAAILTVLNVLLNTIPSLIDKGDQLFHLKERLERFERILDTCKLSYETWKQNWENRDGSDIPYTRLFSKEWEQIQKNKAFIERCVPSILNDLCLVPPQNVEADAATQATSRFRSTIASVKRTTKWVPMKLFKIKSLSPSTKRAVAQVPIGLEERHFRTWKEYTDSLVADTHHPVPDPSVLEAIRGVLGANQMLEKKINELKDEVTRLNDNTTNMWKMRGYGKEAPKQFEDVEAAVEKVQFRDLATLLAVELREGWCLQIHFPQDISDCKALLNEIMASCDFSFVTHAAIPENGTHFSKEVGLLPLRGALKPNPPVTAQLGDALTNLFTDMVCKFQLSGDKVYQLRAYDRRPQLWMKDWQSLLVLCKDKYSLRQELDFERARAALGFTIWMILLWETDWFAHICGCSLRCVLFREEDSNQGDGEDQAASSFRQEHIYSYSAAGNGAREDYAQAAGAPGVNGAVVQPAGADCAQRLSNGKKMYLLGILLAEMLLGKPIVLDAESKPTGTYSELDLLLKELKHVVPGSDKAVKFCFDNTGKTKWENPGKGLSVGNIEQLIDGVLVPIKKYHDTVKEHAAKRNPSRSFFEVAKENADGTTYPFRSGEPT